jgi:protein gp37
MVSAEWTAVSIIPVAGCGNVRPACAASGVEEVHAATDLRVH